MIDLFGNSVQLLGMPLSSAALFLLAGTLLGHLLWYRDRGKNSPTDPDLETRYLKVRSSLKQRKTQVKELQKQNASLDEDLTILRQAHSTLRSKNKRLEQISQSSQDEINQFRKSLNEAEIQIGNEEKRNQTIIDQLQEMIEKNAALAAENQSHQESFEQLDQLYRQSVSEFETSQRELDTLRTLAQDRQTDLEQQQGQITELEERIEMKGQACVEANTSLHKTQQDLVARCKDIDALRAERDQLEQKSQDHEQTLTQLERNIAFSQQVQAERDEFATDLAAAASSLTEQRQTLEQCESELALKTTHLAERDQQVSDLNTQLSDEKEHRLQLEQFNAACQTQLDELESQLSIKTEACTHSENKEIAYRLKVADLQQLVEQQQYQVAELCAIREENAIHSLDLAETRAQLASKTSALNEFKEQAKEWNRVQKELQTTQQTIHEYHERNSALESLFLQQAVQISELSRQADCVPELELALKHKQKEIDLAVHEIEERETTILTAERVCDENEIEIAVAIAEIDGLENRILSMARDIDSLSTDNALLTTTNQKTADQIRQMQSQLKQANASQRQLEQCKAELNEIKQEREQLLVTRDGLESTISRLGKQITNHLAEASQMNEELSQVASAKEKLEITLQTEMEARETTITELKTQLTARSLQHDSVVDDLAAKTSKLDQQKIEIEKLAIQLEVAKTAVDQSIQLTTKVEDLERQLESKSEEHELLVTEIGVKSDEVARQIYEIQDLKIALESAESDRRDRDRLKQEVTELRIHVGCIREELEDSLDTNAKGQDRIRDLENQLHDHVKKIRDLRRERNASSTLQMNDGIEKPEAGSDQKAA